MAAYSKGQLVYLFRGVADIDPPGHNGQMSGHMRISSWVGGVLSGISLTRLKVDNKGTDREERDLPQVIATLQCCAL